ncbi:response regulator transcription factor [Mollicutes bacterium LVI A0039]|nr:response regulator transcription factor [Mollicutes bacterium LVI A0039]
MVKNKILTIDDNIKISKLIKQYGEKKYNYHVDTARTIDEAFSKLKSNQYDLITLDIELQEDNGLERISDVKEIFEGPIIFVSCNTEVETIVEGLEKGADDYITKPFDLDELCLRIQRSLERVTTYQNLVVEEYVIDEIKNKIWLNDRELKLSQIATRIFILLLKEKNNVISREEIFTKVWNQNYSYSTRVIDTHISYIRKETNDVRIRSIRAKGYTFTTE